jgi:hypothetical protein
MRHLKYFFVLLFVCSGFALNAQKEAHGYNISFGFQQPRSSFAKEAYGNNSWTAGCRTFFGADIINFQIGGGFEMYMLKPGARSTTPFMDSIILDNSGDPTTTTFLTCGLEVGTPISFPVRLSVLLEGDVGIYFGKSVYVMRQLRRDPMVHPIHWAAGYSVTSRVDFRILNNDDRSVCLFVQAGFRGHPGQVQKNRFLMGCAGVSVFLYDYN